MLNSHHHKLPSLPRSLRSPIKAGASLAKSDFMDGDGDVVHDENTSEHSNMVDADTTEVQKAQRDAEVYKALWGKEPQQSGASR